MFCKYVHAKIVNHCMYSPFYFCLSNTFCYITDAGVVNFKDDPETTCPLQPLIPMYLMILGSVTLVYEIICFLQMRCSRDNYDNVVLVMLGWLLAFSFIGLIVIGT